MFAKAGLKLFDVEELPTHGGSIRIYACHADAARPVGPAVERMRQLERRHGLADLAVYEAFEQGVRATKRDVLEFLIDAKRAGKTVAAYGAAAKGMTLLNYCGIRGDMVDYIVDKNPYKQGRFAPGVHVPIHGPERLAQTRPDYVLILPWNLRDEVTEQMKSIRDWGGRFVVAIPKVQVLP